MRYARTEDEPDILEEAPLSVKTGRSLDEIAPARAAKSPAKPKAPAKKAAAAKTEKPAKRASSASKSAKAAEIEVAGVPLTHPDRVLWEDQGVTKQELAEFYAGVADWLLPHLVNRPLTLIRCPGGAEKKCFVQRHSWAGMSDFIHRTIDPGQQRQAGSPDGRPTSRA